MNGDVKTVLVIIAVAVVSFTGLGYYVSFLEKEVVKKAQSWVDNTYEGEVEVDKWIPQDDSLHVTLLDGSEKEQKVLSYTNSNMELYIQEGDVLEVLFMDEPADSMREILELVTDEGEVLKGDDWKLERLSAFKDRLEE